ncbi:MAG: DUF721 domain-containing protein [Calditrichaeota bacterium]|nr:DUF721 domain-containing protein [Calditrichota bacterium]
MKRAAELGSVLNRILKDLHIEKKVYQSQALLLWSEVVGEKISKISRAERVDNGILFVRVDSPSWRTELIYLKRDIIHRLNKKIGVNVITDIRFK